MRAIISSSASAHITGDDTTTRWIRAWQDTVPGAIARKRLVEHDGRLEHDDVPVSPETSMTTAVRLWVLESSPRYKAMVGQVSPSPAVHRAVGEPRHRQIRWLVRERRGQRFVDVHAQIQRASPGCIRPSSNE